LSNDSQLIRSSLKFVILFFCVTLQSGLVVLYAETDNVAEQILDFMISIHFAKCTFEFVWYTYFKARSVKVCGTFQ